MNDDMNEQEKPLWARDVATILSISDSTLRKYCLILENNGYVFLRDEHNRRAYVNRDVAALRHLKDLSKNPSVTLEDAANAVVSRYKRTSPDPGVTDITISATQDVERHDPRYEEMKNKMDQLLLYHEKQETLQNKFIERLEKRLEQQENYIEEALQRRDTQLVSAIRDQLEQQRQLVAAAAEEEKKKKNRWKFWKK